MTTGQTLDGAGRSADEDRGALLRLVLKIDAAATGAVGVLSLPASMLLDDSLGIPTALLLPVGLFLLAYAVVVWVVATRRRVSRTAVWVVILVNILWAVDSVVVVAAGWLPLTGLGTALVLGQGAAVALFAAAQLYAVRSEGRSPR